LALIPEAVYGNGEDSSGDKRADSHIRLSIAALEKDEGRRAIEILEGVIKTLPIYGIKTTTQRGSRP